MALSTNVTTHRPSSLADDVSSSTSWELPQPIQFGGNGAEMTTSANNSSLEDLALFAIRTRWVAIAYTVIGVVGILGNLLVCVVLLRSKMRSKFTNIYIVNQCIIDFLTALLIILSAHIEEGDKEFWTFADDLYCRLWSSHVILWSMLVSSSTNLIAMTIERFLEVVHCIWHRNNVVVKHVYITLPFIWLSGYFINLTYIIPTCYIKDGKCHLFAYPSKEIALGVGLYLPVIQFLIPIIVHVYCYIRMAITLLKPSVTPLSHGSANNTGNAHQAGSNNAQQPQSEQNAQSVSNAKARARGNINVVVTLAAVSVFFFLCWVFNQGIWVAYTMGAKVDMNGVPYHLSVIAVFLNSCVNPFVYLVKYRQFQRELKRMLSAMCRRVSTDTGAGFSVSERRS